MSSIFRKIQRIKSGGIPGEVRAINECIDQINYLSGMRTINGLPLSDSGTGPVIDLSQAATPASQVPEPWKYDPYGNLAGWLICENGNYWGTGGCPRGTGCQNFESASSVTGNFGGSPETFTSHPSSPPITPPAACDPVIYLINPKINPGGDSQPFLSITNGLGAGSTGFTYTFVITYDGTTILSLSGSATANSGVSTLIPLALSNWSFDPGGLPGYTQGTLDWIFEYSGAASVSTNPAIIQTFTWTSTTVLAAGFWTPVYMEP